MPIADGPRDARRVSRRELLSGSALALGAAATIPLLGRSATASPLMPAGGSPLTLPSRQVSAPEPAGPLNDYILKKMDVAHVPSLVGAVVNGTGLSWARGYGMADIDTALEADPDTVYMLASISKTIICAAVMQLWEAGSIDLDADINTYLPFEIRNPNFPGRKITTRQLLTHTSSIRDRYAHWGTLNNPTPQGYCIGDPTISLHDILEGYLTESGAYFNKGNFYDLRPGEKYHYSNFGSDVAAYIVEVIAGVSFAQYCIDNIFLPLGMVETGFHLADITTPNLATPYKYHHDAKTYQAYPQFGYPDYPAGTLRTSVTHLSRWLRCFMNFGELDGTRVLKRSTVKEIRRPQVPGLWWQGLIWYYRYNRGNYLLGHTGGDYGVATSMFFETEGNGGVIYLANRYIAGWKAWYGLVDIERRLWDMT